MDLVTPFTDFYDKLRKCYKCLEETAVHCYQCGRAICSDHIVGKRFTCEDCEVAFTS